MSTQEQNRQELDAHIAAGGELNAYGDSADTCYLGGSPLFNEMTGEMTTAEEYHFNKYGRTLEETLNLAAAHH